MPRWTVFANAKYSPKYKGLVELGTYNRQQQAIKRKGELIMEGYKNVHIVEVDDGV
jgi:hypothetical protein